MGARKHIKQQSKGRLTRERDDNDDGDGGNETRKVPGMSQ
jgi:hypothetical protein